MMEIQFIAMLAVMGVWCAVCVGMVYRAGQLEHLAEWKEITSRWAGLKHWLGTVILILLVNVVGAGLVIYLGLMKGV